MLLAAVEKEVFPDETDYCVFGPVEWEGYPMDEEALSLFCDLANMDLMMDCLTADEYTTLRETIWRYWRHYAFGDAV